jgi:multiple sugar transport system substrate-binding protein
MKPVRGRAPREGTGAAWLLWLCLLLLSCGQPPGEGRVVTFPGSAVGAEAELLRAQLARFSELHPEIRVVQRITPDAADQRHQLYVQWLSAQADDPDILQLDVIWTAEFAAAGWILPLDRFSTRTRDFFPATLDANRWRGHLYALPWFVDVGMLYWRTDLLDAAPSTWEGLVTDARAAQGRAGIRYGLVWQAARYEGLVTVFVEHLAAFGGAILDTEGRVVVDSPAAVRALTAMCDAVAEGGYVPRAALGWHEEETRFAFQNGYALFMRNWPYAYPLMEKPEDSRVAGRFGVAPMPGAAGGRPSAALGGSQLAINARSDDPEAAWEVIAFLTAPEQMRQRARVLGQFPPRRSLYSGDALAAALPMPPDQVRRIIEDAVPRPVTPVYTQLSQMLQIRLHEALSGQSEPAEALGRAAREMRALLARVGLAPEAAGGR